MAKLMFKPVPVEQEPKRNYFIVEFPEELNIEPYLIDKINKPKFINYKWQNIEISFIDLIGPSTSKIIYNAINFFKIQKFKKSFPLFSFNISMLDPVGEVIEKWVINVKEVVSVDFGDFSHSDSKNKIQYIKMIIQPSDCVIYGFN